WAVGVLGTPIFLALKGAACVASVVVAAPIAAGAGRGGAGYRGAEVRRELGEGVGWNCGPPYVLTPPPASPPASPPPWAG
ncbi:MAG TPA: hypothetical protein VFG47_11165, partial [Geminicoccaceae bacterium]|nr:hypothetical protein [Geminicoccaceae bacterium]